jgi:hypothetical protein
MVAGILGTFEALQHHKVRHDVRREELMPNFSKYRAHIFVQVAFFRITYLSLLIKVAASMKSDIVPFLVLVLLFSSYR